jgi:uncharacterized membrane protein
VFGFALTLLVVQLDTPMNMAELRNLAGSFLPFSLTFAMVTWIWYLHNQFFRRYGLQDAWTVFLNSSLLFVVLFYVFPLKFLALALVGPLTMTSGIPDQTGIDGPMLMTLYSGGVLYIFTTFVLLHLHARSKRTELGLTRAEEVQLNYGLRGHLISAGLGVASLILAWLMPDQTAWAGIVYGLMGPLHGWNGYAGGRAQALLEAPIEHPPEHPAEHP